MNREPHIALIGVGYWGKNLARNLEALGALHTICDISPDTVERFKSEYPRARCTDDFTSVLEDADISAVMIATPAPTHYELAKRVLLAGKDVYVEKPLCLDLSEGEELIALAEESKRILMVGHILQFHPCVQKLQEMVAVGELGELQYISSHRLNLGKICTVENALWSYGPHDVSMILSLTDAEPTEVRAFGGTHLTEGVPDTTMTTLSFEGPLRAHIYSSWLNPFKEQKLTIVGSKAMAVFDDTLAWDQKLIMCKDYLRRDEGMPIPNDEREMIPVAVEQKEPLREECSHFLTCCEKRLQPRTGGQRALRVLRVLAAAQSSLDLTFAANK